MVAVWAENGNTFGSDGILTLNDGRVFDLSAVPGNGFNANRLAKLTAAGQAFIDKRDAISSLPPEDPDRTHAEAGDAAWFLSTYGNRVFIDGSDIVTRTTKITLFLDETGGPSVLFETVI